MDRRRKVKGACVHCGAQRLVRLLDEDDGKSVACEACGMEQVAGDG